MSSDPIEVVNLLHKFSGPDLTSTLSKIEKNVQGLTRLESSAFLLEAGAGKEALAAAAMMKRLAGQIDVVVHALGILLCLPHILEERERVEYLSLGAGNTGREFDLETNYRVAEFKFIKWQGGAETIRQNSLFKDFFVLAEKETSKRKNLYVLGTKYPLKFLASRRALKSVLSQNQKLWSLLSGKYGTQFAVVGDYYKSHQSVVSVEDVSPWLPDFVTDTVGSTGLA
jgi:hypothetical protein